MNLPESQSTKEPLKNSLTGIYTDIRNRFSTYATYWNAIWRVWKGETPQYGRTTGGNYRHDTIPVTERFTNVKAYEGLSGEINPVLPSLESYNIETVGNQNIYKEKIREFNLNLIDKFGEKDYSKTGSELYEKIIKSYGVNYIVEGPQGIEEGYPQHYYVKEFETFSKDYTYGVRGSFNIYFDNDLNEVDYDNIPKIKLYKNENLTTHDSDYEKPISLYKNNKHYYIVWTGERYYTTSTVDEFDHHIGESYTAPTNLTSNDSQGLTVSSSSMGANTYKVFNGNTNVALKTNISSTNPEYIYFNLTKSLNVLRYTIQADGTYNSYPTAWRLQASNDNSNWVNVHSVSGESFSTNQSKSYSVTGRDYYLYYRLMIYGFKNYSYQQRKWFYSKTVTVANLKKFTFSGQLSYTSVNSSRLQPQNLGKSYNGDMTGIKTYKESMDTNDFQHFSKFITNVIETDVDNKVVKENLKELRVYDHKNPNTGVYPAIKLNNEKNGVVQDNLIRKEDYLQMQRVLDKINAVLKLRDGWFDRNGRCNLSCQVQCQHGCQVSCQHCNTHQCHNQKCGTH